MFGFFSRKTRSVNEINEKVQSFMDRIKAGDNKAATEWSNYMSKLRPAEYSAWYSAAMKVI
jgi:hypothetical protein